MTNEGWKNMKRKYKLDTEEKEILRAYEKGELKSVDNLAEEISKAQEYARNTMRLLRKTKRINIRISAMDLAGIQTIASEEGLPYQSLISSVIHKYVASHR
jgi:predicted DNA binding CopG/RHH family protein